MKRVKSKFHLHTKKCHPHSTGNLHSGKTDYSSNLPDMPGGGGGGGEASRKAHVDLREAQAPELV